MPTLNGARALITGGAGFIGSRVAAKLTAVGANVTVFDNLLAQVHGPNAAPPHWDGAVRFVLGDVRDHAALAAAVHASDPDIVFHLAAETGTGQSYDEPTRYCDVNVSATSALVEAMRSLPVRARRVILAGSRAIYGEGAYVDHDGATRNPAPRRVEDMAAGRFAIVDQQGRPMRPASTHEDLPPAPASVYASTKLMQEWLLTQGFAGQVIEPVILRFQNVYGPGQSLRNPYTGVLSIFCQQILEGKTLDIFEDGEIVRDFVFVDDVVDAVLAAAAAAEAPNVAVNIGSGETASILDAARVLLQLLRGGDEGGYRITGNFRAGDVRHAVADIARAEALLGWSPKTSLADGLEALAIWAKAGQSH